MRIQCPESQYLPFFRKSAYIFREKLNPKNKRSSPKIDIKIDHYRFVIMELASNGFGSPEILYNERVDLICEAYDYLKFKHEYENQSYLISERERDAIR